MTMASLPFRLIVAILTPATLAAQAEPWLAEVPTAKRIVTALQAGTSRINTVRAAAALYSFTNLIRSVAGTQALSAAATARVAELMPERDRIASIEYAKDP